MKEQDTSKEIVVTTDELILLRRGLNLLAHSVEAEEDKAIDIFKEVRGDDNDNFKAYQKRLTKEKLRITHLLAFKCR